MAAHLFICKHLGLTKLQVYDPNSINRADQSGNAFVYDLSTTLLQKIYFNDSNLLF